MISPLAREVYLSCRVLTMKKEYFAKEHEAVEA
jgi:hypothetical protein